MNRYILICLWIVIYVCLSAQIHEFPEVEIVGPAEIKTGISKKPLLPLLESQPEFRDSIPYYLPDFPITDTGNDFYRKNGYLYLDINSRLSWSQYLLLAQNDKLPLSIYLKNDFAYPKDKWRCNDGYAGVNQSQSDLINYDISFAYLRFSSPNLHQKTLLTKLQALAEIKALKVKDQYPVSFTMQTSLQTAKEKNDNPRNPYYQYWNNLIKLTSASSGKYHSLSLTAAYIQKNPLAYLEYSRLLPFNTLISEPFSAELGVTNRRIVPSLKFQTIINLDDGWELAISQIPSYETKPMFELFADNPWSKLTDSHPFSFNPVNISAVAYYNNFAWNENQIRSKVDLNFKYLLDKQMPQPIIQSITNPVILPMLKLENVIQSAVTLAAETTIHNLLITQNIICEKGWITGENYAFQPYLPLLTAETKSEYKFGLYTAYGSFRQYYFTKSEYGKHLRESLELDFGLRYNVSGVFTAGLELNNLLSKGKIQNVIIPTKPFTVKFVYSAFF